MAWRRARAHVRTAAERRLEDVARQWRPMDPPPVEFEIDEPVGLGRGIGSWTRPALRGLALLVGLVVVVAAYGAWSGRPRAVAQAPEVLAVGQPIAGADLPAQSAVASPSAAASEAPAPSAPPAPPAPPDVVVHVAGLVARPGLVRLPAGSRVADAIEEAGGVTRRRAADSVNLARVLVDGEQVVVTDAAAVAQPAAAGVAAGSAAPTVVDLNTATADVLDALPGIGPVIAARIIAWRAANGAFRSVDELGEVSGIGDAILSQVRSMVRV